MKKDDSKASQREATRAAFNANRNLWKRLSHPACVELDVHKDTIAVAVAGAGRNEPESRATVAKTSLSSKQAGQAV